MKKILAKLLMLIITLNIFSACSTQNLNDIPSSLTSSEKISENTTDNDQEETENATNTDFFADCVVNSDYTQEALYEDDVCKITCKIPKEWTYNYRSNESYPECGLELNGVKGEIINVTRQKHSSLSFDKEQCDYFEISVQNNDYDLYVDKNYIHNSMLFPSYLSTYWISFNCDDDLVDDTKEVLYNCLATLEIQEK